MARIAVAQVDCRLGDVGENLELARGQIEAAATNGADLVVFPELSLHGYDLGSVEAGRSLPADDARLDALCCHGPDVLVGLHEDGGVRAYNTALYLAADGSRHVQRKLYPVNYLAWEERKHAAPGQSLRAFDTRIGRLATLICNDAWQAPVPWLAAQDGAEVLLVPADSAAGFGPDALDTVDYWNALLRHVAAMQQCWVIFCNRVGVENGAHFWGGSRVLDPSGEAVASAPMWESSLLFVDVDVAAARRSRRAVPLLKDARLDLLLRELRRLKDEGGDA